MKPDQGRGPAKRPLLTRKHKVQILRFARDHQHYWSVNNWKKVLFSDETRISLKSPDGRERVWRRVVTFLQKSLLVVAG